MSRRSTKRKPRCFWPICGDATDHQTQKMMMTMTTHQCKRRKTCCCSLTDLEPAHDCPVHGEGEWPPRCETCGLFLKWEPVFIEMRDITGQIHYAMKEYRP